MLIYQVIVTVALLYSLLLVARNLRDYSLLEPATPLPDQKLFVLIPVRDDAEQVAPCLQALLAQDWPHFTVRVLDDGSIDGTAAAVEDAAAWDARVCLLRGQASTAGWSGKAWACRQLAEHAIEAGADWLLFLDVDTRVQPELIGRLLFHAQTFSAGMVSGIPRMKAGALMESLLVSTIPFSLTALQSIGAIWRSSNPDQSDACGQLVLVSTRAFKAIGGYDAFGGSLVEAKEMARSMKAAGQKVKLVDVSPYVSCRNFTGGFDAWDSIVRTAYDSLGSFRNLLLTTVIECALYLLPYAFLVAAVARGDMAKWGLLCAAQVALILAIRSLQAGRFGQWASVLLWPIAIFALISAQWVSYLLRLRGAIIPWKGRKYKLSP
jgi:chlorobactene glucosyltransferase